MSTKDEIIITLEQRKAIVKALEELEGFASCLLDKCTHAKTLVEQAGIVSTKPKHEQTLSQQQLAEISRKFRERRLKPR